MMNTGIKITIFGAFAFAMILVVFWNLTKTTRTTRINVKKYPIKGIDISHHQGEIEWDQLKRTGLSFIFIKATEGTDLRDSLFIENWENAEGIDITKGAYHFFSFCSPGSLQAENFLSTLETAEKILLPAVDIEFSGNCREWINYDAIRKELDIFLRTFESTHNIKPILYVTENSYNEIIAGKYKEYPIWVASSKEPSLKYGKEWTFWQYSNRGKIRGIRSFVDLNVFKGSESEFDEFPRITILTDSQKSTK